MQPLQPLEVIENVQRCPRRSHLRTDHGLIRPGRTDIHFFHQPRHIRPPGQTIARRFTANIDNAIPGSWPAACLVHIRAHSRCTLSLGCRCLPGGRPGQLEFRIYPGYHHSNSATDAAGPVPNHEAQKVGLAILSPEFKLSRHLRLASASSRPLALSRTLLTMRQPTAIIRLNGTPTVFPKKKG